MNPVTVIIVKVSLFIIHNIIYAGEPLDLNSSQNVISSSSDTLQFGCPSPQPFILNTNSTVAYLSSDSFNGTQPEDAGNYTCLADGIPRATVEIIVLGKVT